MRQWQKAAIIVPIAFVVGLGLATLVPEQEIDPITYDHLIAHVKEPQLTDAQRAERVKSHIGKRVRWQGWVLEVKPGGVVWVDLDAPDVKWSVQEVYLETSDEARALQLSRDDRVIFDGKIKSVGSALGKYYVIVDGELVDD